MTIQYTTGATSTAHKRRLKVEVQLSRGLCGWSVLNFRFKLHQSAFPLLEQMTRCTQHTGGKVTVLGWPAPRRKHHGRSCLVPGGREAEQKWLRGGARDPVQAPKSHLHDLPGTPEVCCIIPLLAPSPIRVDN